MGSGFQESQRPQISEIGTEGGGGVLHPVLSVRSVGIRSPERPQISEIDTEGGGGGSSPGSIGVICGQQFQESHRPQISQIDTEGGGGVLPPVRSV